jgi:hypothetical protein
MGQIPSERSSLRMARVRRRSEMLAYTSVLSISVPQMVFREIDRFTGVEQTCGDGVVHKMYVAVGGGRLARVA